jgi:hypothetical protein
VCMWERESERERERERESAVGGERPRASHPLPRAPPACLLRLGVDVDRFGVWGLRLVGFQGVDFGFRGSLSG